MSESPLIDWADEVGLTSDDFSEVLDKALILATRLDVKLQSLLRYQGRRQAHNDDVIRVLSAAFLLQWMLDEAAFDWGWDTDDFEPSDMMGEMLQVGTRFLREHRVPVVEREDDEEQD